MFKKENILRILTHKGWSKYRLAKEANIPQSSLHDILSGKIKNPTAERLKSIADALGVSVNDFFDDEYKTKKESTYDEIEGFKTPQEAMEFILKQPALMAFGGYDLNKMSDDEIIEFANELLRQLKILSYKYKK